MSNPKLNILWGPMEHHAHGLLTLAGDRFVESRKKLRYFEARYAKQALRFLSRYPFSRVVLGFYVPVSISDLFRGLVVVEEGLNLIEMIRQGSTLSAKDTPIMVVTSLWFANHKPAQTNVLEQVGQNNVLILGETPKVYNTLLDFVEGAIQA